MLALAGQLCKSNVVMRGATPIKSMHTHTHTTPHTWYEYMGGNEPALFAPYKQPNWHQAGFIGLANSAACLKITEDFGEMLEDL